jgi:catechol 2,3-dioxygenase-like lactoylglutathione lyase family enzyme
MPLPRLISHCGRTMLATGAHERDHMPSRRGMDYAVTDSLLERTFPRSCSTLGVGVSNGPGAALKASLLQAGNVANAAARQLNVQIDHAVITVGDQLDAAADLYRRLGFNLTERGHHTLGSSNHLAIFATDYLELLGFLPGQETTRADLWRDPPGLTGLVFKPGDPEARYADLKARGVPVEDPLEFSRPVALADGVREARFRVLRVAPGQVVNGRTFFCHHYTPELVWRPEWQQHPNGAAGVAEFVIATRDPGRTAQIYERMFGPDVLKPTSGGIALRAGAANVSMLDPAEIAARFRKATEPSVDGSDRMVALILATKSVAQARAQFDRAGIPYAPYANGVVVGARFAAGVALAFVG